MSEALEKRPRWTARTLNWVLISLLVIGVGIFYWRQSCLTQRIAEAETALETEREGVQLVAEEKQSLAKQVRSLTTELEQAQEEVATERAVLETTRSEAAERTAMLEERLQTAEQTLAQERQEAEALVQKLGLLRSSLEGSDPERAAALAEFESRVEQAENARAELESTHEAQLAELQAKLEDAQGRAASEQEKLASLQQTQAELESELAGARTKITDLETTLKQERQIADESQEAQRCDYEERVASLTEVLTQERAIAERSLAGQRQALTQRIEALEENLSQNNKIHENAKRAWVSSKADLQQQVAAAEQRIAELEQSLDQNQQIAARTLSALRTKYEQRIAEADKEEQLLAALGGAGEQTPEGLKIDLKEVQFGAGATNLPRGPLPTMDRIARMLAEEPGARIRIEGHTDSVGTEEVNLALSQRRADAVRRGFVARGVDASRIEARGVGEAAPIADNSTPAGRRENRRVEVYVLR